ncbi:MAG TPA: apolipoprotein N-acyltransferase, partial [Acetobacteraceae bacterium]|nr:apolipoprotein N-acyltransferase [Acetobacteraceae bacterium]
MFRTPLTRLSALRGRRAALASLLLGALSALALPPFHLIPVLLVAVPGLLALIGNRARMRDAAWIGFWFGFGHHLIGLYWITEAILVVAAVFWWLVPFAVPAVAAVLAVFVAAPAALAWRARSGAARALALAGGWVLADIARQFVLTGFPWNLWGSVWAVPGRFGDVMLQPAALIGADGMTLLTLLLAATPVLGRRAMAGGALLLAAWAGFGVWRLSLPRPAAPDLGVVLVQGDVPEGVPWSQERRMEVFTRYLRLTHDAVMQDAGEPLVVIWPETASPFLLPSDANARDAVSAAAMNEPVISGTIRFDEHGQPHNSMAVVLDHGTLAGTYDKSHLVPFGEYQPSWL